MDQVQHIIKTAESAQPNTTLADAKISMVGFSVAQKGHSRLLQRRQSMDHRRHADRGVPDPGGAPAFDRGADLPGGIRDPLVPVGGGNRGGLLPIHSAAKKLRGTSPGWRSSFWWPSALITTCCSSPGFAMSRTWHPSRGHPDRRRDGRGDHVCRPDLCGVDVRPDVQQHQRTVQIGFIIGVGLLLDTFLVRTITVPAMAVLVGRQTGGRRN